MPKPEGTAAKKIKKKRKKKDWASIVAPRASSKRPAAAACAERNRDILPAGRSAGFVSGRGLGRIGVNKRIATSHLIAKAKAEKESGAGTFQQTLFKGMTRYKRSGMGDAVTDALVAFQSPSLAHGVPEQAAFRADRSFHAAAGRPAPGLKASGLSRNHLLADSSIASIAHMAMSNFDPDNPSHRVMMHEFFSAIAGSGVAGGDYLQSFMTAHHELQQADRPDLGVLRLHNLIDTIAVSPNNMVIADDARNTNQGARFDPVMDSRGRLNPASQRIMDAVVLLQEAGLVSENMRQAVLSMAHRTADRLYESSSSRRPVHQEDLLDGFARRRPGPAGMPAASAAASSSRPDGAADGPWDGDDAGPAAPDSGLPQFDWGAVGPIDFSGFAAAIPDPRGSPSAMDALFDPSPGPAGPPMPPPPMDASPAPWALPFPWSFDLPPPMPGSFGMPFGPPPQDPSMGLGGPSGGPPPPQSPFMGFGGPTSGPGAGPPFGPPGGPGAGPSFGPWGGPGTGPPFGPPGSGFSF